MPTELEWPVIAEASGDSWSDPMDYPKYREALLHRTLDTWWIKVRADAKGHVIVYAVFHPGVLSPASPTDNVIASAMHHDPTDIGAVIAAIGIQAHIPTETINECIRDLLQGAKSCGTTWRSASISAAGTR